MGLKETEKNPTCQCFRIYSLQNIQRFPLLVSSFQKGVCNVIICVTAMETVDQGGESLFLG